MSAGRDGAGEVERALAAVRRACAGVQAEMVETEPERFFRPPYVGHRGWLGVLLAEVEQDELDAIVREAYRAVAPKTLLARLDAESAGQPGPG